MLAKLFGTSDFTPDDVVALEYSVAMFLTIPNFGLRDWKELKTWMEHAGQLPARSLKRKVSDWPEADAGGTSISAGGSQGKTREQDRQKPDIPMAMRVT